ncbi:hypothetical protein G6F35_017972 [Rhizopus arrhizus]|nr:hypothetical protein G6F35_017972 [Rhizopus arrhizus]
MAGAHVVAHAAQGGGDVLLFGLLQRGGQCGVQRQARGQQAGQLARQPGQIGVRQAGTQAGAQSLSSCRQRGGQRQQSAAAQLVAGAPLGVGIDRAAHDFAKRVGRFVTEGRHG